MRPEIKEFMEALKAKTVGEAEFHQAVEEVIETVWDTYQANPKYKANKILEKMVEPERVIMFRVPWIDDKGEVQINRGYRVQFNSAIGPYKGGLRFHPSVTLGGLKFNQKIDVFDHHGQKIIRCGDPRQTYEQIDGRETNDFVLRTSNPLFVEELTFKF